MDTTHLGRILAADPYIKTIVSGVVPKDGLPTSISTYPTAFICNTDDGYKPSQHWIGHYVNENRRSEYFDSFRVFLRDNCREWTFNDKSLQCYLSNVCGQYYVAYLLRRCGGIPMKTLTSAFGTNLVDNDCRVFDWLKDIRKGGNRNR